MSIASTRARFWQQVRQPVDAFFLSLPLPKVNPDVVSFLSVVVAFLFVLAVALEMVAVSWLLLLFHLVLDGLDGAIAKRYASTFRSTPKAQEHGMFADLYSDRISEGILFVAPQFFLPWFPLFIVNVLLSVYTVIAQRAMVMPFRQLFFVVYTTSLLV